jgi:transposase
MRVVAGVDCHKDSHSIAFVDATGQVLVELSIPATPQGYALAVETAKPWGEVGWGLEGSGMYGRAFADALLAAGATVFEVPGILTKRHRKHASRRGKSDRLDARAIAEAVLREGDRLPRCDQYDEQVAVRLMYDRRDRLVRQRTEATNRLRSLALRLILPLPEHLSTKALQALSHAARPLRGKSYSGDAMLDELDETLADLRRLDERIEEVERRLRPFTTSLAPELLELRGASHVVAAGLIGHAGNLHNCRNAAAFAMRAGVAPVDCTSGRSQHVRINTGGHRQLNRCLHQMAIVQLRFCDHAGRKYYDRKRSEGKTHKSALRSLKRQLATVVFFRLRITHTRLVSHPPEQRAA